MSHRMNKILTFNGQTKMLLCAALLGSAFSGVEARAAVQRITPLGNTIAGMPFPSLSTGGEFVVGRAGPKANMSEGEAAIWSAEGGISALPKLPGHLHARATDITSDGSAIVGFSGNPGSPAQAVRWTDSDGIQPLWTGGGNPWVSADGSTVVGELDRMPVRWREADGVVSLGMPTGADRSWAVGASADGRAIAVRASIANPANPNGTELSAFSTIWTEDVGYLDLGPLPEGWVSSRPWNISDDGRVLLGNIAPEEGNSRPFLWSQAEGFQLLPELDGESGREVFPLMMTADASIVVGDYFGGPENSVPFVWDRIHGTRRIVDVLRDDHGLDEVFFNNVRGLSPDGSAMFVSNAIATDQNWESWIIQLDGPLVALPQPGDTNGDGVVDLADLNNVRNHFGGAGLGDTNADGVVDLEDLNAVRNNFGAGGAAAVPEPSAMLLLSLGMLALGIWHAAQLAARKNREMTD
jgi:uncharacterized membrane protein